ACSTSSGLPRKRSGFGIVWVWASEGARLTPTTTTPPAFRKSRRVTAMSAPSRGGAEHRADDARVAAAAAEIARQRLAHLRLGRAWVLLQEGARGDDHAGRAVAALRGLLGDEGGLDRIGALGRAQAFDRRDGPRLHGARGRDARPGSAPVDQDGAGAALREAAAEVGPGEPEVVSEHIEERRLRIVELDGPGRGVHVELQGRHAFLHA